MKNVGAAIFIRLGDRARPYAEAIPKPGMGKLSDVIIDNIIAENIGETGCSITGLPGYPAEDIKLSNISIEFEGGGTEDLINREIPEHPSAYPEYNMFGPLPSYGFYCRHCKNIRFDNIDLGCKKSERRPAFIYEDVEMIQLNGIKSTAYNASPVIRFSGVSNAFIQSCIACKGTDTFLQLKGVENLHITLMGNDLSYCKTPVTGENSSSVFLDSNRMPPAYGLSDGPYVNCGIQFIDDRVIKIHTPAGVKAKRNQIIRAIWGSEMIPDRTDVIVTPHAKNPIDQNPVISRVDKLEIPVNAVFAEGVTPVKDLAYLFLPFRRSNRLVIINPGHACTLRQDPETNYRIEPTIIGLLEAGFDVLAVFMPHVSDTTCDLDHCKIINTDLGPGDHPATYGLRFFLEPEIVCLNYLTERTNYKDISMVGLSGGGWTTNLLAAIDERIRYSFSVAGSMPIYYRSGGSIGDIEQFLPEMYRDIAGYPDLYVLGSYGKGRKQVQILNRNDDCCFGQKQHDPERDYSLDLRTFEKSVKERLKALGSIDNYYLVIDETAPNHQISEYALKMIILKELLSKN